MRRLNQQVRPFIYRFRREAIGVLTVLFLVTTPCPVGKQANSDWLRLDPNCVENGDIIFRRGKSRLTEMVLQFDVGSAFSHVGLVVKAPTDIAVVHVSVGESPGHPDIVRVDSVSQFLSHDRASSYAIFRLRDDGQRHGQAAVNAALRYAAQRIPFDSSLDVETPNQLYCSELVWRAYFEAGVDLVNSEFDTITFLGQPRSLLSLSLLLHSPALSLVVAYPPVEALGKETSKTALTLRGGISYGRFQ